MVLVDRLLTNPWVNVHAQYVEFRQAGAQPDSTTAIKVRHLEGLIRLAEARARVNLSPTVRRLADDNSSSSFGSTLTYLSMWHCWFMQVLAEHADEAIRLFRLSTMWAMTAR